MAFINPLNAFHKDEDGNVVLNAAKLRMILSENDEPMLDPRYRQAALEYIRGQLTVPGEDDDHDENWVWGFCTAIMLQVGELIEAEAGAEASYAFTLQASWTLPDEVRGIVDEARATPLGH